MVTGRGFPLPTHSFPTWPIVVLYFSVGIAHAGNFTTGDVGNTYTIVVSNTGDFATTGTVSLTDTLPIGLTATAFSGDGWTVDLATVDGHAQ